LDEPLSNLDAAWRAQLIREFRQLHRRLPTTTVFVTHDQAEAMSLGGRVAVMQGGSIRQIDSPGTIYDQPRDRFVAGFIGTPPMNFWEGELSTDEEQLSFVGGGRRLPLDPVLCRRLRTTQVRQVTLGIRPADVSVVRAGGDVPAGAVPGRIALTERCGHGYLTRVKVGEATEPGDGGPTLTALTDVAAGLEIGERVVVRLRPDRVHLFAASTGENLTLATTPGGMT
jgi:multiple sugar transport system ATP-binding protein